MKMDSENDPSAPPPAGDSMDGDMDGENIANGHHGATNELLALLTQLTQFDDIDRFFETISGEDDGTEMPKSLIITNLDIMIFRDENSSERQEFEAAFREFDCDAKFLYFKSFRRARVDYTSSLAATKARIFCHQKTIGQEAINCFFADLQSTDINSDNIHLRPPVAQKQFLISPPASPPEGWHPCEEGEPVLNIDLQSALANLLPGSAHEIHPPSEHQPGIVVHIAGEAFPPKGYLTVNGSVDHSDECSIDDDFDDDKCFSNSMVSRSIPQTACPPR